MRPLVALPTIKTTFAIPARVTLSINVLNHQRSTYKSQRHTTREAGCVPPKLMTTRRLFPLFPLLPLSPSRPTRQRNLRLSSTKTAAPPNHRNAKLAAVSTQITCQRVETLERWPEELVRIAYCSLDMQDRHSLSQHNLFV